MRRLLTLYATDLRIIFGSFAAFLTLELVNLSRSRRRNKHLNLMLARLQQAGRSRSVFIKTFFH